MNRPPKPSELRLVSTLQVAWALNLTDEAVVLVRNITAPHLALTPTDFIYLAVNRHMVRTGLMRDDYSNLLSGNPCKSHLDPQP